MKPQACLYHYFTEIRLFFKARHFRGTKFQCPLCGFNAAAFLPSPDGERKDARCPRCDSLERHRAQWLFGLKKLPFTRREAFSVLHITPEFCITGSLRHTWPRVRYHTSQFPADGMADHAYDVQRITRKSASVDVVICNHVLEHVPDDRGALAELYRILNPGGFAFVQVPVEEGRKYTFEDPAVTSAEDRTRLFGQEDHVRVYGEDVALRFREAGFSVSVVRFWEIRSRQECERYALTDREPVYICRKKGPEE